MAAMWNHRKRLRNRASATAQSHEVSSSARSAFSTRFALIAGIIVPAFPMLTTTAFDHSHSRRPGIGDLIAEPEGLSLISSTAAQHRVDRRCS